MVCRDVILGQCSIDTEVTVEERKSGHDLYRAVIKSPDVLPTDNKFRLLIAS